jgi:hypothetical protein
MDSFLVFRLVDRPPATVRLIPRRSVSGKVSVRLKEPLEQLKAFLVEGLTRISGP